MQPPSVIIAANPYEAELCRRALVETGLRVVVAEGGEGALEAARDESPLLLVVALGIFGVDPLELVRAVRAQQPTLAIFLLADRDGDVPDEEAAARLGVTRLFLRPIEIDALADAIEKRAVEAEVADEIAEAMAEFDLRPPTIDASPLVEESIVEMEADWGEDELPPQPLPRIELRKVARETTEVMKGVIDVPDTAAPEGDAPGDKVQATLEIDAAPEIDPPTDRLASAAPDATMAAAAPSSGQLSSASAPHGLDREPRSPPPANGAVASEASLAGPPPSVMSAEPLMRADDALTDLGLRSLVVSPDFVVKRAVDDAPGIPEAVKRGEPAERARPLFDERSTFARRLEHELSAAERRLFPDSPSTASASRDEYEDALGDIDLDALGIDTTHGIDTIPGIGADALDAAFELKPLRTNGHINGNGVPPELRSTLPLRLDSDPAAPAREPLPSAPLPDDEGDLDATDVATLLATLHAAGFTGAVTLERGDGDKTLYFDAGMPVTARSSFAHDRLVDLLLREGVITREQHGHARDVGLGGRSVAQELVERGLIKSSELFATQRRHTEEIIYSCFGWERGRYRLSPELPPAEDRVRLGAHPWALFVEGVRRKYGLERLVELVGPPETVLSPTTTLARALEDGGFSAAERARAELIDGERTLAELSLGAVGASLSEARLYALAWALIAIGAARLGGEVGSGSQVRSVPTLVTSPYGADRRTRPRPSERPRDRELDRTIDRERVMAKRAQVQDGDYFAVLGLDRDASAHEVSRAFERLKRDFAPERFADPLRQELSDALGEIGEVLDEAHRVLADDVVRASYRAHLLPS